MFDLDTLIQAMEKGAEEYLKTSPLSMFGLFSLSDPLQRTQAEEVIKHLSRANTAEEKLHAAQDILNNLNNATLRSYLIDKIENSNAITDKTAYQNAWREKLLPPKHPIDATSSQPDLMREDAGMAKARVITAWLENQLSLTSQEDLGLKE